MATIEERLAALEARAVAPLALTPPITIGELANVPAPGSQLAAQWAQDATTRVVHVFPNIAALQAWAAPNGCYAHDTATGILWRRIGGVWSQFTPWQGSAAGIAAQAGTVIVATLAIPADPGPRIVNASCHLMIDVFYGNQVYVELLVGAAQVASASIPRTVNIQGSGANTQWNIGLTAGNIAVPVGGVNVQTRVTPDSPSPAIYHTLANIAYNRVDALVTPRGY